MPSLTLETSPKRGHTPESDSRSTSPTRPPFSPITPTLAAARIATKNDASQQQTYTHSQAAQVFIPQPPSEPINFEDNPDVLALKSAISILQMQKRNATEDIRTLRRIKERALQNPEEFARALTTGEIKSKGDELFHPSGNDEDDDIEMEGVNGEGIVDQKAWEKLPTPQNVVRTPAINWAQYAIVGESLDKLHADQQTRPLQGMPQRTGPDGQIIAGGEGLRRPADLGVAAPYQPGKDRIEKAGAKKGGKK